MKKRMNDKGFSLVELIIVVAIMVILVAILAPTYLKYVEKSRVASDQQTVVEFIDAMQVVASDPDYVLPQGGTYTVTAGTGVSKITASADLITAFTSTGIMDSATANGSSLQSSGYQAANVAYSLEYDATTTTWRVKADGTTDLSGALPAAATP